MTLFHRLPAERAREIKALLRAVAAGEKPIEVEVGEARTLERGVAIFLKSPRLHALREELAAEWWPWLADRDRAGFRPHVTIQTTESEAEARRTLESLRRERIPRRMRGVGLHLWRYRDGPWESEALFRFPLQRSASAGCSAPGASSRCSRTKIKSPDAKMIAAPTSVCAFRKVAEDEIAE